MKNYVGLFIIGVGIGIFLGLSESPILLQVLIPILTIICGLLSILTGQKNEVKAAEPESLLSKSKNISPFPIMWMVVGMVVGAFGGLYVKYHDPLGIGVDVFDEKASTSANQNEYLSEPETVHDILPNKRIDLQVPKTQKDTTNEKKINANENRRLAPRNKVEISGAERLNHGII